MAVSLIEEIVRADLTGNLVRLRTTAGGSPVCPVCGCLWSVGTEHAWQKQGNRDAGGVPTASPTFSICPCCNTEFGNDDIPGPNETLESTWAILRERWLKRVERSDKALAQLREHLGLEV